MSEYLAPFEAMLAALFPPERVRAIDGGADWSRERGEVERSGFLDALAGEDRLPFAVVADLWRAIGTHAAPREIGEVMIERAVPAPEDRSNARALLLAAAMAGAAGRVLELTVAYAGQRSQFGKPIGRQQAVQQQLAVMAEQVTAMRLAVELAAAGTTPWPSPAAAALAKTVAATYAPLVANTAHAVHGAIGISAEHDLPLFTRRLHAWRLEGGGESLWARRLGKSLLASRRTTLDWMRAELFA
ncbi:MAG: acyl-CoA dehydrogenase family protein [Cypionkella sp.]